MLSTDKYSVCELMWPLTRSDHNMKNGNYLFSDPIRGHRKLSVIKLDNLLAMQLKLIRNNSPLRLYNAWCYYVLDSLPDPRTHAY